MILSMKDICKTYDNGKLKIPVLFDINLEVENGEFLGVRKAKRIQVRFLAFAIGSDQERACKLSHV